MRKKIGNDIKQLIIDRLEDWIKWCEIAKELSVSSSLVSRLKKEIEYNNRIYGGYEWEWFDMIYTDEWEMEEIEEFKEGKLLEEIIDLKRSEEQLLKKNQKLQDWKNLSIRQIRAINRKDSFYEELTTYFQENIDIDLSDKEYNPTKHFNNDIDCVVLSDSHFDEVISLTETGWREEFNFDIFQRRLRKLEQEIINHKNRFNNKYLNIFLLGDMISWLIHEELYENGEAWKFDILYKWASVIAKFIINISKWYKDVYIYTKAWNHWRLSKSIKFKRTDENFDNILYVIIRSILKTDKRIKFNLSTSFKDIIKINNFKIGIMHWDLYKAEIFVKESQLDLCLQWHLHTAKFNAIDKVLTNGSFNKWNGFVTKMLSTWSDIQHQTLFTLKQINSNKDYALDFVKFIDITTWFESFDNYNEILTEKMIFGWNENYEWNVFEQTIGNYR